MNTPLILFMTSLLLVIALSIAYDKVPDTTDDEKKVKRNIGFARAAFGFILVLFMVTGLLVGIGAAGN